MRWKDFFYYQKGERIAIIVLLALILLVLIFNGILSRRSNKETVIVHNEAFEKEFEEFQASLKEGEPKKRAFTRKNYKNYSTSDSHSTKENYSDKKSNTDYIPFPTQEKLAEGEKISLNETDTAEWKKIPGIGSTYATRIVKYRNLLGGFARTEQLREVYGMNDELFSKIAPYVKAEGGFKKIAINKLEFKTMLKHPYLNYDQVKAIFDLRKRKGNIQSIHALEMLDEFTSEDIEHLKPYLEF